MMAHEYSVQLHVWLNEKIEQVEQSISLALTNQNKENKSYFSGQLAQLKEIRMFLTEKIDLDTQTYY